MASAAYERRNAAARAEGYDSYYHKRISQGRAPTAPRPSGEELAQARGHRGAADLDTLAASGRIEVLSVYPSETNSLGQWTAITVLVQLDDGSTREYTLRGKDMNREYLTGLYDNLVLGVGGVGGTQIADRYNVFGYYVEDA